MFRSRPQQGYKIKIVRGERNPVKPLIRDYNDSNGDEDTESEEHSFNENDKKIKLLHRKVEKYEVANKSKNIKLPPKTNRLSSFILKNDNQEPKYRTVTPRRSASSRRNCPSVSNLEQNSWKYSIKNPFKQNEPNEELIPEDLYINKRTALTPSRHFSKSNPDFPGYSQGGSTFRPEMKTPHKEKSIDTIGETEQKLYETFLNQNATKIQAHVRGHLARKVLLNNLNFFYNMHNGIDIVSSIFDKRSERLFWYRLKLKSFMKKKLYLRNNIGNDLFNIPRLYKKNIIITQMGLRLIKKETADSFQFIRQRVNPEKEPKSDTYAEYVTKFKEVVDYKIRLKNKILRQLLIMKMRKEERTIGAYFRKFLQKGLENQIKKKDTQIIKDKSKLREDALKLIVRKNIDKRELIMKRNFAKFYYLGVMKEMTMSQEERNKLLAQKKLAKLVLQKDKDIKKGRKTGFMKFYYGGIVKQFEKIKTEAESQKKEIQRLKTLGGEEAPVEKKQTIEINPIELRNKKLKHLVLKKERDYLKKRHDQFMKFYYRGVYRQMVLGGQPLPKPSAPQIESQPIKIEIQKQESIQPTKPAEEKKIDDAAEKRRKAKELRRLIGKKGKLSQEKVKFYFHKFYLNGIIKELKQAPKSPKKRVDIDISGSEILGKVENTVKGTMKSIQEEERKKQEEERKRQEEEKRKLEEAENERKQRIFDKVHKLFYQKQRNCLLVLKSAFTKWNLMAKILSFKPTKKKKKGKKKVLKKKEMPMNEDNENVNPNEIEPVKTSNVLRARPRKPMRPTQQVEEVYEDEDDDDDDEYDYDNEEDMRDLIKKHCKLDKIFKRSNSANIKPYFEKWAKPLKNKNPELETFKARLFGKLLNNAVSSIMRRRVIKDFEQWKQKKIKKNKLATDLLASAIKKISNRLHFSELVYKYIIENKKKSLKRVINNTILRVKRNENTIMRKKLYRLLGYIPLINTTQVLLKLSKSLKGLETAMNNIKAKRMKKKLMKKLKQKFVWERPIGNGGKLSTIKFFLKNGKIYELKKDERILRNYFWRWGKPKKYYFRVLFLSSLTAKQKELEKVAKRWQIRKLETPEYTQYSKTQ